MNALATEPEHEAQVTEIAEPQEAHQLKKEGDRWVEDLARILGVEPRNGGLFGGAYVDGFASHGGLSYGGRTFIGK